MNSTAIMANTTASGVMPPANEVAAPMERAVATAGAMCVIDWNSTSGRPMALRARPGDGSPELWVVAVTGVFLRTTRGPRGPRTDAAVYGLARPRNTPRA